MFRLGHIFKLISFEYTQSTNEQKKNDFIKINLDIHVFYVNVNHLINLALKLMASENDRKMIFKSELFIKQVSLELFSSALELFSSALERILCTSKSRTSAEWLPKKRV